MKKFTTIVSFLSTGITIFSGSWVFLCAIPGLTEECILIVTAILLGAGTVVSIASLFIPELPRLPREQGRSREINGLWGLLFLLAAAFLLVLDWENHAQGKELFLGWLTSTVATVSVLNCFGVVCTALAGQQCLCWNEEGFALRTILGRVRHYGWEAITARDSNRGVDRIYVGKACYVIPSSSWRSDGRFLAYAFDRRRALGLPPIPRKTHWPWGGIS